MKNTKYQIVNIIAYLGMVFVNFLANYLPLNGKTTGELSDLYPNLFVPAGITFSIWGVIYILLFLFVIYQAKGLFQRNRFSRVNFVNDISWFFLISSLANMSWIFSWHYEKVLLSFIIMIVLLLSLIKIYLNLDIGRNRVNKKMKYFVHLPFSIYLGWITVATIANASAVLVHYDWDRFGLSEVFWTVFMIIVAVLLTVKILKDRNDLFYSLVIIWSFLGIIIKRMSVEPVNYVIIIFSLMGMGVIIIANFINRKNKMYY